MTPRVWAVTTGEAGMRAQARGLAGALDSGFRELIIGLRHPWRLLRPDFVPFPLRGLDPSRDRPVPPWPQVLATCGRRSAAVSIAIRRASGGRTLTIHIGDPRTPPEAFDLIFPMAHDRIRGPNVLPVLTALNEIGSDLPDALRRRWAAAFAAFPRPLTGVLVGGSTRRRPFGLEAAQALAASLRALGPGGRLILPSRRTPTPVRDALRRAFASDPATRLWDGEGDNPYRAALTLCDDLVVTSDSVSMISEALATDRPLRIFDLGLPGRHARFVEVLLNQGLAGRLGAEPPPARRQRIDSTALAARRVRELMRARGWVASGAEELVATAAEP